MIGDGQGGGPARVPALSGMGVPNRHKEPKGNVYRNKALANHGCCELKELCCLEAKEGIDESEATQPSPFYILQIVFECDEVPEPVLTAGRIRRAAESVPDGGDSVSSMTL